MALRFHRFQLHWPAEIQIQASAAGVKMLRPDLNQTGWTSQQNLLLNQNRCCGECEQESQSTIHGSSGRFGRGIGVIFFGITTASPLFIAHGHRHLTLDCQPLIGCWFKTVGPIHGEAGRGGIG
jgi:hypothetical protein